MSSLTVWKFPTPYGADAALDEAADPGGAATDRGPGRGRGHLGSRAEEAEDPPAERHHKRGALGGGFWGLLFGLIFFVPLLGLAIGAASGALFASMADVGISDQFIKSVRDKVTPGTSALFLLSSDAVIDRVKEEFQRHRGRANHHQPLRRAGEQAPRGFRGRRGSLEGGVTRKAAGPAALSARAAPSGTSGRRARHRGPRAGAGRQASRTSPGRGRGDGPRTLSARTSTPSLSGCAPRSARCGRSRPGRPDGGRRGRAAGPGARRPLARAGSGDSDHPRLRARPGLGAGRLGRQPGVQHRPVRGEHGAADQPAPDPAGAERQDHDRDHHRVDVKALDARRPTSSRSAHLPALVRRCCRTSRPDRLRRRLAGGLGGDAGGVEPGDGANLGAGQPDGPRRGW